MTSSTGQDELPNKQQIQQGASTEAPEKKQQNYGEGGRREEDESDTTGGEMLLKDEELKKMIRLTQRTTSLRSVESSNSETGVSTALRTEDDGLFQEMRRLDQTRDSLLRELSMATLDPPEPMHNEVTQSSALSHLEQKIQAENDPYNDEMSIELGRLTEVGDSLRQELSRATLDGSPSTPEDRGKGPALSSNRKTLDSTIPETPTTVPHDEDDDEANVDFLSLGERDTGLVSRFPSKLVGNDSKTTSGRTQMETQKVTCDEEDTELVSRVSVGSVTSQPTRTRRNAQKNRSNKQLTTTNISPNAENSGCGLFLRMLCCHH